MAWPGAVAMAAGAASAALLRGLFGAAEAALGRLPLARARVLAAENEAGRAMLAVKTDPEGTWWTTRMADQLLTAVVSALAAGCAWDLSAGSAAWTIAGGAVGLAAALGLDLFGRAFAATAAERWARALAGPLAAAVSGARPVRLAAVGLVARIARRFCGGRPTFAPALTSIEDVEAYLALEAGEGRLGSTDPELLRSVLEFSEKTAREVMVPRTRVVGVELSTPPAEVVRIVSERGHSRLPVYRETMDDIVGILHARDLVPLLAHPDLIVIQDAMRPATFVPWAKRIGALLREMQGKRSHLTIVVDEYGGVMGVVTLEDILEEIVGEIGEELRPEGRDIQVGEGGSAIVRAGISLGEFERAFGVRLAGGEYETLGGFLNAQAGAIPEQGDHFYEAGLQFTVVDRGPRRVRRVRVVRTKGKAPGAAAGPGGAGGAPGTPSASRKRP